MMYELTNPATIAKVTQFNLGAFQLSGLDVKSLLLIFRSVSTRTGSLLTSRTLKFRVNGKMGGCTKQGQSV